MKLVIFGCGNIAHRIAKSCKLINSIELAGFASKNVERAKQYSNLYGCLDYGDYNHFLNSDIDAVYIATYNDSHLDLIKKCIENKKNVICEKPMLSKIYLTEDMFRLAKNYNVLLMEALKSVFLPLMIKVKNMIKNNEIGDIEEIYSSFMRCGNHPSDHWINNVGTGGALKDLGSYCVGTMNYIMDKPAELVSIETDGSRIKADTTAHGVVDYDGVVGKFSVSNSIDGDNYLFIKGSRGYIKVDIFWKTGIGKCEIDGIEYILHEELISDFYYELKHFNYLVNNKILESNIMSKKASIDILRITTGGNT